MNTLKFYAYNILFFFTKLRVLDSLKLFSKYKKNIDLIHINEKINFKNYKSYKIIGKSKSDFLSAFNEYTFKQPYILTLTKGIIVGKEERPPIILNDKYEPILESCDNSFYCLKNSGAIVDIYKSIFKNKKTLVI